MSPPFEDLDARSYIISEIERLKNDISELFDKLSTLKDTVYTDKASMVSHIATEFSNIAKQIADLQVKIALLTGDSNANATIKDLDTKLVESMFKQEIGNLDIPALRRDVDDNKKALAKISEDLRQFGERLSNISWRVGLLVAIGLWLVNTFGTDFVKDMWKARSGPAPQASSSTNVPAQTKDTIPHNQQSPAP